MEEEGSGGRRWSGEKWRNEIAEMWVVGKKFREGKEKEERGKEVTEIEEGDKGEGRGVR